MLTDQPVIVYVTTAKIEEARKIAGALLEERLIACGNILPQMESVYRWNGKVEHDAEVVLLLKTTESNVPAIGNRIKELHSYDLPCVVSLPISGGNSDFLSWIVNEIEPKPKEN